MRLLTPVVVLVLLCALSADAQEFVPFAEELIEFPKEYVTNLHGKATRLERKIDKKARATLANFKKQEEVLSRKLYKRDSVLAKQLMQSGILDFNKLQQVLQASNNVIGKSGQYLSRFDTLKTSLNFLSTNIDVISGDKIMLKSQLAEASKSMTRLGDKLRQATAVEDFIKGRKQLLKSQFETVGMVRALRKFNKQAYYYSAQMKEYRALIGNSADTDPTISL